MFTWPLSKLDSAQNNLIVQALLKIATLRRRLWQARAGCGGTWGLPGQVLVSVNTCTAGRT